MGYLMKKLIILISIAMSGCFISCSKGNMFSGAGSRASDKQLLQSDAPNPSSLEGKQKDPKDLEIEGDELEIKRQSKSAIIDKGCVHVKHGGSASEADDMNKDHSYPMSCSVIISLSDYFDDAAIERTKEILLEAITEGLKAGIAVTNEPDYQFTWDKDNLNEAPPAGTIAPFSPQVPLKEGLTILIPKKGSKKWSTITMDYQKTQQQLSITYAMSGWGKCRYTGKCYSYLNVKKLTLIEDVDTKTE
jgi:hypothetical protein